MRFASGSRSTSRSSRFRALISAQGINPFVEVPARVADAFSRHAQAGRVAVEGKLNGIPVRATLIPAGGRHRLYVNGGMRAAAGVGVGDRVTLELRAVTPGTVTLPPDVAAAMGGVSGARAGFAALSPSHRRELLRYIDDARTPEARKRRIARTIDHALGRRTPGDRGRLPLVRRPVWTCPRCGNEFVNRNQLHSCRRYEIADALAGKSPQVRELFERFRTIVEACGPVKVVPYRDKFSFMVRVRFAGAVPRKDCLDVVFWLSRRLSGERFRKIETLTPDIHIHAVRITERTQLDVQLAGWIKEAYAVGCQDSSADLED